MATVSEIKDDLDDAIASLKEVIDHQRIDLLELDEILSDLGYIKGELEELDDQIMELL